MKYGVKFLSPARFDRDPFGRLRFHPLKIHVRYRDYSMRDADALEEVVKMFGCKSRSRALQVVTKYIQPGIPLDELRRTLSNVLCDWRYLLIYDQRKKRDEIIAYRARMTDLKEKMGRNPESAETAHRQLRALGIVA